MKRLGILLGGLAAGPVIAAVVLGLWPHREGPSPGAAAPVAVSDDTRPAAKAAVPTLYCEFANFADRTPLVGFYFTIEESGPRPVYAQIFQREQDGTQDDFGGAGAPRPAWSYDGSQSPAVIRSPDETTQINLYDYDAAKPGSNWFEAGLRSIRYRNLGGRCRHSQA